MGVGGGVGEWGRELEHRCARGRCKSFPQKRSWPVAAAGSRSREVVETGIERKARS